MDRGHLLLVMSDNRLARRIADDLIDAFGCHVVIAPSLRVGRLLHARGGWAGLLIDGCMRNQPDLLRLRRQNQRFGHAPLVFVSEAEGRMRLTGRYARLEALVPVLDQHAGRAA